MRLKKENIPNILSCIRIMMVPLFVVVFFSEIKNSQIYSLAIFIAAQLTDVLDGYLARRNGWITEIGKLLDPIADKMMSITAFICLAIKQNLLIILAVIIITKEISMVIGGSILLKKRRDLVVSLWYGKMATVILAVSIALMILMYDRKLVVIILSVISAAAILFSLIMYYIKVFRGQYKKTAVPRGKEDKSC